MRPRHAIAALALGIVGAWMLVDGGRALLLGDYARPTSGEYAGQLGPWAWLVGAAGLDPESAVVKAVMALHGAVALALAWMAAHGRRAAGWAALSLVWYLPFGTVAAAVAAGALLTGLHES